MHELSENLSNAELEQLDRFLLERIDENAVSEGMDEGVLDISELDGLFTAIVSGPFMILPSQWLPAVWGDFEPEWESEEEFQSILTLMMRHMNGIATMLMDYPGEFEPIYMVREVEGRTYDIVDDWCEGYRQGVELGQQTWNSGGEQMATLLVPIYAFTEATDWRGHDYILDEMEKIQQAIAPNVREIHAYWLEQREPPSTGAEPFRRSEPRVGRNDPCPCGSGKKYKKCCLH